MGGNDHQNMATM